MRTRRQSRRTERFLTQTTRERQLLFTEMGTTSSYEEDQKFGFGLRSLVGIQMAEIRRLAG
jgi:hypothetical protein